MAKAKQPNVITAAEVARRKGTSRQAIYQAMDRGSVNAVTMGRTRLILVDEALDSYLAREPRPGERLAASEDSDIILTIQAQQASPERA